MPLFRVVVLKKKRRKKDKEKLVWMSDWFPAESSEAASQPGGLIWVTVVELLEDFLRYESGR